MAKKKRGRPRVEYLIRSIEVRSVRTHLSTHIDKEKRRGGSCWMEVRGVFDEPVKGQSNVAISVHEQPPAEVSANTSTALGHLIQMRPECRVVVTVPPREFDRAWTLAAGGRLTHAWLSMTTPHYNDATVPSVAFANEPIE
jgi:hypothetical protein